ncbi:MAG: FAD-dependent monooxygenase [Chloroflexota bacterium]
MEGIDVPVLIVGGGPTGLCASILLSRHGIRSLLIERHAHTAQHPKVRGESARTMEIFRPWGIEQTLRGASLPPDQLRNTVWLTTLAGPETDRVTIGYDPALYHSNSPTFPCGCAQDTLEPTLLAHARTYPQAEFLFNHELISFDQDDAGVRATVVDHDTGEEKRVHASYLIGADGASSLVRQSLGIPMPGPVLTHLISILFRADLARFVEGRQSLIYRINNPQITGFFVAVDNADRWNFHVAYHPESGETVDSFTEGRCTDIVRQATGVPDLQVRAIHALPWSMAAQVAEQFRRQRVFLAGDAAHVMPPTGGYGMNTGIADVHNLAWKLAGVLSGWASAHLLDTYETERLPVARFTTQQALINAQEMQSGNHAVVARYQGIGVALGYSYDLGAIVPDGSAPTEAGDPVMEYIPTARPGSRAPHVWLQEGAERLSTLDLCERSFVLLSPGHAWCAAAEQAASGLGVPVHARVVHDDSWARLYEVSDGGAVLVRPDGHVAWRVTGSMEADAHVIECVLNRVLGFRTSAKRTAPLSRRLKPTDAT